LNSQISVHLGGANLSDTVLNNLKAGAPAQAFVSDTLNTTLVSSLANAAMRAGYSNLATLIQAIPPVDIVASKDLSLRDFVSKEVKLPDDATAKSVAEAAIAQLSSTTTVGDLLNLNSGINDNPIFTGEVNKVDLANLLKTSPALAANAQLIDDFVGRYAGTNGSLADFWKILSQDSEFKAAVSELQFTLQLGTLTQDNPSLVSALRSQYPNNKAATQLASLSSSQWQQLVTSANVTVPAFIPGATPAEKATNYAASIVATLKAGLPGTYFVSDLQGAIANSKDPVDQGVATFLNNASGFDILNTNLNSYIVQNSQTLFNGIDATQQSTVSAKLATWQRLARIAPDFSTANALANAGFASAYDIATTPRSSFLLQLAEPLGSSDQADCVYGRAQRITASAMTIFSNLRQGLTSATVRGIGDINGALTAFLSSPPSGIPNWQTLFGSTSYCSCTDCRSVYSAAAYFVDLLQFLRKSSKNSQGYTPLDILIGSADGKIPGRRPDLPYLKLNCENTNTTLPYVDLVNEILEGFLVINTGNLNRSVEHDTPSDVTSSDLSVSPEYTNDKAYNDYLNAAVYPPTLPFDRWLTTARTYLGFLGSGLYQVMAACQTGAAPAVYSVPLAARPATTLPAYLHYDDSAHSLSVVGMPTAGAQADLLALSSDSAYQAAISDLYTKSQADLFKAIPSTIALACEYLNISQAECAILTGRDFSGQPTANPPALYDYYGYSSGTVGGNPWEQDIAHVETFLQKAAIGYDDLVCLLETRALNPKMSIMLLSPDNAPCDLTQTTIVDLAPTGPVLQDSTLALMHRFIRLWKQLGWKIEQLDKTMTALKATDIDQQFLVSLAAVGQLLAALNIPLLPILSFWSDLDTDGRDSLYLRLFQNKAVLDPPDSAFQLQYVAPLAAPPTLQFPSLTFPNLCYSTSPIFGLESKGAMSDEEYDPLKSLSLDASYASAISLLQGGKATVAKLPSKPAANLPAWLNYNPSKQQISITGQMSDDQRGTLNFSRDPTYQTAIDVLYNMRTPRGTEIASSAAANGISNNINQILAALRISAQELALIRAYSALQDELTLANLSALCRYVFLAQGLNLSIGNLLTLIALTGTDPFAARSPAATLAFVQTAQTVQASSFSIDQLNYIYRNVFDPNAGIAPLPANVSLFLTTLQAGLASIANADVVVPDPKGTLLAKNLATLLGSSLANAAMGLINATGIYSAPLAALPAIALPTFVTYNAGTQMLGITGAMTAAEQTQLLALSPDPTYQGAVNSLFAASQAGGAGTYTQSLPALPSIGFPSLPTGTIAYNAATQQLQFTGPMSSAEETTLLALSSDPSYQAAIQNLRQRPIDFINGNFSNPNSVNFLVASDAINQLVENPLQLTTAAKVLYVAKSLMPYLRRIQCEGLITQTLADNLEMTPQMASLLLKTILSSQVNPGKAFAMADFLALIGDGLSAAYYTTKDLTGSPALTRIEPTVNFDWGFGLPDPAITTRPFSVEWKGWVMPQYSETYTFYVRAGDGTRLWVNGVKLVDSWVDKMPVEASGTIALSAGQLYQIELDYYDDTASGVLSLSWSSPSTPKAIIPQSQLFSGAVIQSLSPITNSYNLLYKTALLADTLPLTTADVSYLYQHRKDFAGVDPSDPTDPAKSVPFDPNLLPLDPALFKPAMFNQWQRLNAFVNLRSSLPGGDAGLLNIFSTASSSNTATAGTLTAAVMSAVTQATGWNPADLAFLVSAKGFNLSDRDFDNERGPTGIGLVRLQSCFALVTRLGVSAEQIFSWSHFGPDPQTEEQIARNMQMTVKSKYDDSTWVTVGKPLNDKIREASKEALIACILAHSAAWNLTAPEGGPITTSDQLYEFFLIDVNMSPCMLTSRIVQATAAIQLFVQRCLLNLESTPSNPATAVSPSAIDTTVWNWMQNYRVWQANREVFFYPENWMVPTLRDDMTPFFKDLENTLLQNPVSAESAEQAYLAYLRQLNEAARLDIRAIYWQYDVNSTSAPGNIPDATNDVLHVFARTQSQPYTYYYRTLQHCSWSKQGGGELWTPWEVVDLDISGDHLVPVVWEGRLYLFWPIFQETADPSATSQPKVTIPPIHVITSTEATNNKLPSPPPTEAPTPDPIKDLQITLAWSEYSQGAWSPKSTSDAMVFPGFTKKFGPLDTSRFTFGPEMSGDSLAINVYMNEGKAPGGSDMGMGVTLSQVGLFSFSICGSSPSPSTQSKTVGGIIPFNSYLAYDSVQTLYTDKESMKVAGLTFDEIGSFLKPPDAWILTFPQQFFCNFDLQVPTPFTDQPFFFQDSKRVYFVTESYTKPSDHVADASRESPQYSRRALTATVATADVRVVFPTAAVGASSSAPQPSVAGAGAAGPPADATSTPEVRTEMASGGEQANPPSQIVFTNFFHPFACSFIKALNQYGLPGFLTLFTQAKTNDNRVISGFVSPYLVSSATPELSPGILVTKNAGGHQMYEAEADTQLCEPPANQKTYLYFNSTKHFYYSSESTPDASGDALLGTIDRTQSPPTFTGSTVFELDYSPTHCYFTSDTYPRENVDFSRNGAYSIYNWELFFHIPLLIATSLSQNQQFSDAQTWFNYIFNPTTSSTDPIPQRFWNCLPFYECSPWDQIQGQIQNILFPSGTPSSLCGQDISNQINQWKNNPFEPFLIGRLRTVAFRMNVVMAYLNNLIAWGDSLFTQNTRESINEATQIYMLAKEILGERPVQIPLRGAVQDYNYNELVNFFGLGPLSNALVVIENDFPYLSASTTSGSSGLGSAISMSSVVPYFCVPPNDTLLGYWDTVDDRLYKIRHCMNIQGQVEQLPLFAPPISPALLVAATAAGVDLSSALSNTSAGPPFYRFKVMVQKALELCAAVQSLGAALLSALEKQDAETLALLRATQESSLLQAMRQIKQSAINAAQADVAALQAGLQVATDRLQYYNSLVQDGLIPNETQQLSNLNQSGEALLNSQSAQTIAQELHFMPSVQTGASGWGGSPYVAAEVFSVEALIAIASALGAYYSVGAQISQNAANMMSLQGQWTRRASEWAFQLQSATDEIIQINTQISAANFRLTMAQQDQSNLNLQIQNAQAVQNFLTSKYTNAQLYSWMVDQISTVFFQCYQMVYDLATQAEAAFRFERGVTSSSYIQFGYWDSLKKGLLSGERLYADLKRMEVAYLESDLREYEISKSISLLLFDPWALIALKETGQCAVSLPEAYFDMDYPGHYFRRLKTVSLAIPCVTGPYTSVNCTLTLLNSRIRVDNTAGSKQDYTDDAHFITNYAATQSIATSTAQNDSGLFEVNFQDERYLPFEGGGVISTWQIELPQDCNAFDFESISDVILNLKYTSRYGGDSLRSIARQAALLPAPPVQSKSTATSVPFPTSQTDLRRLFSLKHEFPTEWYKFLNPADTATTQSMQIALGPERFPFQYRQKKIQISQVELFLLFKNPTFLSEYAGGSPLVVHLGPPAAASPTRVGLASNASILGGLGYASTAQPQPPTPSYPGAAGSPPMWALGADSGDIEKISSNLYNEVSGGSSNYYHLKPAAINDILLLCHYSVSS